MPGTLMGTYDEVHLIRAGILNQVFGCLMPPSCAPQLTPDERQKILQWFVCLTPNN
jgi:hypothetical protein